MTRPAIVFGLSTLLVLLYGSTRLAGWADHTSVIAGMPVSSASWILGPSFVALHLAAVVVAPILAIAATLDTLLLLTASRS